MNATESVVDQNEVEEHPDTLRETPEDEDATKTESTPTLSKKAMKKAKKLEAIRENRLKKRAKEKEMRKEKKREQARKRDAGELDDSAEREERAAKKLKTSSFGGKVLVDLGFDGMMSDKEINSLCTQLAYSYSRNRGAGYPFELIHTSVNGRTRERLEDIGDAAYKRWHHAEWWEDDYERLWSPPKTSEQDSSAPESHPDVGTVKKTVVYLTADSEEEVGDLKPDEIYVIGGICDHNRYKNLTLKKANEQGIRTARLPIGRYVSSLPTRKVLTVNQVFEIMLKWVETRDWEQAFYSIIPQRKFQKDGKGSKGSSPHELTPSGGDGAVRLVIEEALNGEAAEKEDGTREGADETRGTTEEQGSVVTS
ncbi:hypothetical protein D9758_014579 [Tetrapyrgos nigripes]|uniref:tRNA (guanine(9)-N1)-methyltransferase n=1 Tax=Tetrapyrgos nigripes TaxID=182062 RepID=A0A8H5FCY7_9AGAR|nr:hypothetical protein D9758_014579 [Tetrapyrgos nigripes]